MINEKVPEFFDLTNHHPIYPKNIKSSIGETTKKLFKDYEWSYEKCHINLFSTDINEYMLDEFDLLVYDIILGLAKAGNKVISPSMVSRYMFDDIAENSIKRSFIKLHCHEIRFVYDLDNGEALYYTTPFIICGLGTAIIDGNLEQYCLLDFNSVI